MSSLSPSFFSSECSPSRLGVSTERDEVPRCLVKTGRSCAGVGVQYAFLNNRKQKTESFWCRKNLLYIKSRYKQSAQSGVSLLAVQWARHECAAPRPEAGFGVGELLRQGVDLAAHTKRNPEVKQVNLSFKIKVCFVNLEYSDAEPVLPVCAKTGINTRVTRISLSSLCLGSI